MHFFYLDETGDTGRNLLDPGQPIFVIGGISLRDEGWVRTQEEYSKIITNFFAGQVPRNFELHAHKMLGAQGEGHLQGRSLEERCALAEDLLSLIGDRKHGVHFIALDKKKMAAKPCELDLGYDATAPYLLGFDYMITHINWFVKERLGRSARGMIIFDQKKQFQKPIEGLIHHRRFGGAKTHRVKWISEFGYSVDSRKNPMVQLSDLVIYMVRRFLEIEHGHRPDWSDAAKHFYASAYQTIVQRAKRSEIIERKEAKLSGLNDYLRAVGCKPARQWKKKYGV